MKVHHVNVRMFSKKEDLEHGMEILKVLLPEDAEIGEKLMEPEVEGGVFTAPLHEISARISGGDAAKFFHKLLTSLDDYDFSNIVERKFLCVDDECNFYMRLSKKEAEEGNIVLDSKDSIHITVKLGAYPAKKDVALQVLDKFLRKAEDERKVR